MTDEAIDVEIDDADMQRMLRSVARGLPGAEVAMVQRLAAKATPILRGTAPKKTGKFARTIRPRRDRDGAVVVGSRSLRARILDEGGVITPRSGAAIAIPLPGVSKRWPKTQNLQMVKWPGRNPLLIRKNRRGEWEPRFVLVRQVVIGGSNYIGRAADQVEPQAKPTAVDVLQAVIDGAT